MSFQYVAQSSEWLIVKMLSILFEMKIQGERTHSFANSCKQVLSRDQIVMC
jgi:hypothetical protein